MECHVCEENKTDFTCHICGEPVCEDCCVVPTYHNQLDFALCTVCEDGRQAARYTEAVRDHEQQEAIAKKKKDATAKRLATYRRPENVAKRKAATAERRRLKAEQSRQRMEQALKFVADMFR